MNPQQHSVKIEAIIGKNRDDVRFHTIFRARNSSDFMYLNQGTIIIQAIVRCEIIANDKSYFGYSFCSDKDQFSRFKGQKVAYFRALKALKCDVVSLPTHMSFELIDNENEFVDLIYPFGKDHIVEFIDPVK